MGYFPSIENNFADALKKNALVILVNPCRPFFEHEIDRAVHFVEQGGRLLILDGPQNKNSTSNQLLKKFKIHIDFTEFKREVLLDRDNKAAGTAIRSGSVRGGEAFLKAGGKKPVFSVLKRGKGVLGVMADSYLFTNLQMGGTQVKPSEKQLKIYGLEFYVISTIENYIVK
jgi:hypothetical protein